LTTGKIDDIIVNMGTTLIQNTKQVMTDGSILEIVVWLLPTPVKGSTHLFKYRLFFGRDGQRIVGFDNERGKGDHCHLDGVEVDYVFVSTDRLLADFRREVMKRMNT
jgi:hypothetical protein